MHGLASPPVQHLAVGRTEKGIKAEQMIMKRRKKTSSYEIKLTIKKKIIKLNHKEEEEEVAMVVVDVKKENFNY